MNAVGSCVCSVHVCVSERALSTLRADVIVGQL